MLAKKMIKMKRHVGDVVQRLGKQCEIISKLIHLDPRLQFF